MLRANPRIPAGVSDFIQVEALVRDHLDLDAFAYSKVETLKTRNGVEILAFYGERKNAGEVLLRECTISMLSRVGFNHATTFGSLIGIHSRRTSSNGPPCRPAG